MNTVLISPRIERVDAYHETRAQLDLRWAALSSELQLCIVPAIDAQQTESLFAALRVHLIVLGGGNDNPATNDTEANRIRLELDCRLCELALAHKVPLLGVCRGAQYIVERFGGKLSKRAGHVRSVHQLTLMNPSWSLNRFDPNYRVNSFHNSVIDDVGPELRVTALAEDNSVEAFEHPELPLAGIMWHPEREAHVQNADRTLLHTLLQRNA